MGLDDLLAKLERAAGTAGTAGVPADVPANPLQTLAGTAGTAGTAEKDKGGGDSGETLPTGTAPPIRATRWLLHFTDRDPVTVWITPPATHGEVLTLYPESVAAEPAPLPDEPPSATDTDDDRRTCRQCADLATNLSGEARCLAAWRGELKDIARHYHPVADVLHRCGAFRSKHVLK